MGDRRSKEDYVHKLSTSIFITNFPDQFSARDLWRVCRDYGNVIDSYIPNRRSKAGNKFGFVLFIKIDDIDRLLKNLCTIWVGHFRLHANVVRFQRTLMKNVTNQFVKNVEKKTFSGEAHRVYGNRGHSNSYAYAVKLGSMNHGVEEEKKPALVLDDSCTLQKGFEHITLRYMGGFWVMIQFQSKSTKDTFMAHVGVGSWFSKLQHASKTFNIDGRVTWIITQGKVYWVRAKEVTRCVPKFAEEEEDHNESDVETIDENIDRNNEEMHMDNHLEVTSEEEDIPETIFKHGKGMSNEKEDNKGEMDDKQSDDPFNIYRLLNKTQAKDNGAMQSNGNLMYPLGLTPREVSEANSNMQDNSKGEENKCNRKCHEKEKEVIEKKKVSKTNLKENDEESVCSETKMENIDLRNIKMIWGNYAFDSAISPSVGSSGGILCAWDPCMFCKENVTMSDYFVAITGLWVPLSLDADNQEKDEK
ncbi:nucleotide-binding alpha-beta plait domain-containing protein [Tanacetum coccineum]